jgi:transglutaminase-like putative cysteine protease
MKKLLYAVSHTTTYEYLGEVALSHHLLRLNPRSDSKQLCIANEVTISPTPGARSVRPDYFGNATDVIAIETAHQQLVITAKSQVAVGLPFAPEPLETPPWETVRARCHADRSAATLEALEFIYPSPLVAMRDEFADYGKPSFRSRRPVLDAVTDLARCIHGDFAFDATATTVTTPLSRVLQQRRGVCQDFAHLLIACLRAQGLPARYVSGYIETDPPPGMPKLRGVDASHAWVGFFCPGIGWLDIDPTNNCIPSLRHITIGWGRDYSDVPPIRGVLVGGQNQSMKVAVDVNAVGPWDDDLGQKGA